MKDKFNGELIATSAAAAHDELDRLVRMVIGNAIQEYEEENVRLQEEIARLNDYIIRLEEKKRRSEEYKDFYRKEAEMEKSKPKLRDAMEVILSIVTLFFQKIPQEQEYAQYIHRRMENVLGKYGTILYGTTGVAYDQAKHESKGCVDAMEESTCGTVKEIVRVGFAFDEKLNIESIKQQVIVYSDVVMMPKEEGIAIED